MRIALAFLVLFALAPVTASALALHSVILCLNSTNSCDLSLHNEVNPVNRSLTEQLIIGSQNIGNNFVQAGSLPGALSAEAHMQGWHSFAGPRRPEGTATLKATVNLCDPASPNVCINPGSPVPIPWPNLNFSGFAQVTGAGSAYVTVSAHADGAYLFGDIIAADSTTFFEDADRPLAPTDGSNSGLMTKPGTPGSFVLSMTIKALAGCSGFCDAHANGGSTLKFVTGEDAFLGVPDGWTIQSDDLNIVDNRWIDPTATVPVPAPLAMLAVAVGGLVCWSARARTGRGVRGRG